MTARKGGTTRSPAPVKWRTIHNPGASMKLHESKHRGLPEEPFMGTTNNVDEATARSLQWLQSNIKDGLLLTICRAVLQRDEQALQAVCTQYSAGEYAKKRSAITGCNRELASSENE